jgi:3-hydroxy-9,10-secoandrosta-1,3,5(10)-triene-9,17-dione monooxygenase
VRHEVLERIEELGPYLKCQAEEAELLGRLPDETAKQLKDCGVVRLLQPKRFGGYEADPRIFFEAVMAVARNCSASGWVSGIIGVHPWQLASMNEQVQQEMWGDDPDTWLCSTYMPGGRAIPVDGGFRFSGRWGFASGCDVSDWIILGGLTADPDDPRGTIDMAQAIADPNRYLHFILPRADYTIVEGSWEVVGLSGTGSKDIVVEDVFIPTYRTVRAIDIVEGTTPGHDQLPPTHRMSWGAIFPNAITSAIIGIAEGAADAAFEFQRSRISMGAGGPVVGAPVTMSAIGQAVGEIDACRAQLLRNIGDHWDYACAGEAPPPLLRARTRRDQVASSWRATRAVDTLFDLAGGGALRKNTPLQKYWRDAHAGLHHVINTAEKSAHSYASVAMGLDALEPW